MQGDKITFYFHVHWWWEINFAEATLVVWKLFYQCGDNGISCCGLTWDAFVVCSQQVFSKAQITDQFSLQENVWQLVLFFRYLYLVLVMKWRCPHGLESRLMSVSLLAHPSMLVFCLIHFLWTGINNTDLSLYQEALWHLNSRPFSP